MSKNSRLFSTSLSEVEVFDDGLVLDGLQRDRVQLRGSSPSSSSAVSTTAKVAWAGVRIQAWSGDQSPSQPRQPVDHFWDRSALGPTGVWSSDWAWCTA
jgi:hypothetical protein